MKKRLVSIILICAMVIIMLPIGASATDPTYTVSALTCSNGSVVVSDSSAQEGDIVEVTVRPNSGYIPKAGSIVYTYNNNGVVTKALVNRVSNNTTGTRLYFKMPAANVSVYAEFASHVSNNFTFDIVGSSVKKSGDTFSTGGFDGLRFVSRLYYEYGSRNTGTGVITLKKDGSSVAVSEMGVLYAASSSLGTNSLEYSGVGSNGVNKQVSYTSADPANADFYDVTTAYVDFAATITPGENISDTNYTARSYIKFADGAILYSTERTDFADNVAQRAGLCSTDDTLGNVDVTLTAHNNQQVNGAFGGFGAVIYSWHETTSNGYAAYKQKAYTELDRMQDAGIKKVRVVFPVLQQGHYNFQTKQANVYQDWFMNLWVEMLNALKARGIDDVMINYSWGSSIQTLSNGNLTTVFPAGTDFSSLTLNQQITAYGQLCAAYTDYLLDAGCDNVKSITFFSEPGNGWKVGSSNYQTKQQSALLNFSNVITTYGQCVAAAKSQLTALGRGSDVAVVSGNLSMLYDDWWNVSSWSGYTIANADRAQNWFKTMLGKSTITGNSNAYTYHYYGKYTNPKVSNYSANLTALNAIANDAVSGNSAGVAVSSIMMDEVSVKTGSTNADNNKSTVSPFEATQLAEYLATLMNKGYKGAYLWTFSNITETDNEAQQNMFGLMPNAKSSDSTPYSRYYAFSLISKYMNRCTNVFNGDQSGNCIAAYGSNPSTGKRYIMIANLNNVSKTVKLAFSNAFGEGLTLYRHIYNPSVNFENSKANVIGADKTFAGVTASFIDTLPAGAVAIYTTDNS